MSSRRSVGDSFTVRDNKSYVCLLEGGACKQRAVVEEIDDGMKLMEDITQICYAHVYIYLYVYIGIGIYIYTHTYKYMNIHLCM